MIAARVLGVVGAALDWSLIHGAAWLSDRVEGRGADCYRRADALADMEAGREVWEAGELAQVWCCCDHDKTLQPCGFCRLDEHDRCTASFLPGRCDEEGVPCDPVCPGCVKDWPAEPSSHGFSGECPTDSGSCGCGRSAAVTTPAADNTTDHLTALLDYHVPVVVSSGFWGCEGCSWIGPKTGHTRHVAELITDMTSATGRVQQKLGGAS